MRGKQDRNDRMITAAALCAAFCIYMIVQSAVHFGSAADHNFICYLAPFISTVCLSACVGYLTFRFFTRKK